MLCMYSDSVRRYAQDFGIPILTVDVAEFCQSEIYADAALKAGSSSYGLARM